MNQEKSNNESIKLLAKIYNWRKHLIVVTIIAAIISSICSVFIKPQFKGTAIVFPARTFSVSKLLIEKNIGGQEDYMEYGDEDDAEKLLQILNSSEIKDRIAKDYDLWSQWDIKKGDGSSNHYLKLKWDEMITFKRTEYVSIKIDVCDYDPIRAANIANSIVSYADTVKFRMSKEIAKQALVIVEDEYSNTITRLANLEDSLQKIRELGILDYSAEIIAYSKAMAKAVSKGNETAIKNLSSKLETLKKYGNAYNNIAEKLFKYREKYPVIKQKYDEALVNYNKGLPSKFVVEKASPNEKKVKPLRLLIVFVSTITAFILALLYLLFTEKLTMIKKKIELHLNSQNL